MCAAAATRVALLPWYMSMYRTKVHIYTKMCARREGGWIVGVTLGCPEPLL